MEETPKKGFVYWFINVFWYHYGKLSILVVFLAAAAIWMTVEALKKEKYDLNVAVVSDVAIARSDASALSALFAEAAGDVNGDGKALVNIVTVTMEDEESPETGRYQALLYLSLPEYTIFLMNEEESARYWRTTASPRRTKAEEGSGWGTKPSSGTWAIISSMPAWRTGPWTAREARR